MRAKRIDENQNEIVRTFRDIGCSVYVTSMVGGGFPDLVIGYRGNNYLLELKRSEKATFTPQEKEFFATWQGQVARINSVDEAVSYFARNMAQSKV